MTPEINNDKYKDRLTFIGFLYAAYYALLACYNTPYTLRIGYITLVGFIIVDKLFSKDRLKIEFPKACIILSYFTAYCYFSRLWAWNEGLVVNYSDFLVPVIVFMVIAINYFVKIRSVKACLFAIILSGLALSIYVIIDNGGLSSFYSAATEAGNRLTASDRNENSVGMICAFAVVALFHYAFIQKKKICYLIAVLPFVVSMASGSRKSILLLAVGVLSLIVLSQRKISGMRKPFKLVVMLLALFVAFQAILSLEIMGTVKLRFENMFEGFFGTSVAITNNASAEMRLNMIKVGLRQFKETPFLGIGFGNSSELNWQRLSFYAYSHNDYVEHLINGGIFSLILYYGTVIYLAVKHLKLMKVDDRPELVISFTTLVMFVVMGIGCVTYYNSMTTYLYFTLWISVVTICEREQKEKFLNEGDKENSVSGVS